MFTSFIVYENILSHLSISVNDFYNCYTFPNNYSTLIITLSSVVSTESIDSDPFDSYETILLLTSTANCMRNVVLVSPALTLVGWNPLNLNL